MPGRYQLGSNEGFPACKLSAYARLDVGIAGTQAEGAWAPSRWRVRARLLVDDELDARHRLLVRDGDALALGDELGLPPLVALKV